MARVLVVDDEEGVRSFLAECLEGGGHEVDTASNGEQALLKLGRRGYHLLLTDLKMPRMDGLTLLKRVRAEQPELEVIVLTAHGSVATAVEAMKVGAFDFLEKPVDSPEAVRLLAARALERQGLRARQEVVGTPGDLTLTYGAPAMVPVIKALQKVSRTEATVLLQGESGTGKEVTARAIHAWSARAAGPFVAVNCASLSDQLLESELFGHEKGAFTGAVERRQGKIELAEGGTFFLDEVGELRLELQARLLRVLQERRFERVGGTRTLESNVRWVAATNRDLQAMVSEGRFREDLYHRLGVFPIHLPPLRERPEDILPIARALLTRIARDLGRSGLRLEEAAAEALARAEWPGNVRELSNALERGAILTDDGVIRREHLLMREGARAVASPVAAEGTGRGASSATLEDVERAAILKALERVGGNRKDAARQLGIGLRTLYDKLKKYRLDEE